MGGNALPDGPKPAVILLLALQCSFQKADGGATRSDIFMLYPQRGNWPKRFRGVGSRAAGGTLSACGRGLLPGRRRQ